MVRVLLMGERQSSKHWTQVPGKAAETWLWTHFSLPIPSQGPERILPLPITVSLLVSQYLEEVYSFSVNEILREKVSCQKGLVCWVEVDSDFLTHPAPLAILHFCLSSTSLCSSMASSWCSEHTICPSASWVCLELPVQLSTVRSQLLPCRGIPSLSPI